MFPIIPCGRCLLAVLAIAVGGASTSMADGTTPVQRVPASVTSVKVNIRPLRGPDWLKPDPIFTVNDRALVRRLPPSWTPTP